MQTEHKRAKASDRSSERSPLDWIPVLGTQGTENKEY